jgi:hypothetical protein
VEALPYCSKAYTLIRISRIEQRAESEHGGESDEQSSRHTP